MSGSLKLRLRDENIMTDLEKAIIELEQGNYTIVLVGNKDIFKSNERGVTPLLKLVESEKNYSFYSAADKVVGKAAAFLYIILGIKKVHGNIISKLAADIFDKCNVEYTYNTLVENIKNRTNTGFCPMESAVKDLSNPQEALEAIKHKLRELNNK